VDVVDVANSLEAHDAFVSRVELSLGRCLPSKHQQQIPYPLGANRTELMLNIFLFAAADTIP
jgi:hypothetical protein